MAAGAVDDSNDDAALTRRCAAAGTVRGIDVSYFQGRIDWDRVADDNIAFAFIRVSDGTNTPDSRFERNWSEAKRVGIRRGAYQYFRPNQNVIEQADLLIERIGSLQPGDLPPVLDVETTSGLPAATVRARVRQWLDHVEAALSVRPILYTGPYFWEDEIGTPAWAATHPLWVAHYTTGCALTPLPWTSWTFHQFTDSGQVAGISGGVDVNTFNGSEADLDALLGLGQDEGAATGAPMGVSWQRASNGDYTFVVTAPAAVESVEYRVDGFPLGTAARTAGDNFSVPYTFTTQGVARELEVFGRNAAGATIARSAGLLDTVPGAGAYIKQLGDREYEIGVERASTGVAAIEVTVDGAWHLRDADTGHTRSPRRAVRTRLLSTGTRSFEIRTFNADGSLRGSFQRSFTLR